MCVFSIILVLLAVLAVMKLEKRAEKSSVKGQKTSSEFEK